MEGRTYPSSQRPLPANDQGRPFWVAFAYYRAGKHEEAEKLLSSAGMSDWLYEPPTFQALHAMTKANWRTIARPPRNCFPRHEMPSKRQCLTIMVRPLGTMASTGGTDWSPKPCLPRPMA